jgi:hypothetical protein
VQQKKHELFSKKKTQQEKWRRKCRDPEKQSRELPAMAPLHDPAFQRDIRTIPINGTRNLNHPHPSFKSGREASE